MAGSKFREGSIADKFCKRHRIMFRLLLVMLAISFVAFVIKMLLGIDTGYSAVAIEIVMLPLWVVLFVIMFAAMLTSAHDAGSAAKKAIGVVCCSVFCLVAIYMAAAPVIDVSALIVNDIPALTLTDWSVGRQHSRYKTFGYTKVTGADENGNERSFVVGNLSNKINSASDMPLHISYLPGSNTVLSISFE